MRPGVRRCPPPDPWPRGRMLASLSPPKKRAGHEPDHQRPRAVEVEPNSSDSATGIASTSVR